MDDLFPVLGEFNQKHQQIVGVFFADNLANGM